MTATMPVVCKDGVSLYVGATLPFASELVCHTDSYVFNECSAESSHNTMLASIQVGQRLGWIDVPLLASAMLGRSFGISMKVPRCSCGADNGMPLTGITVFSRT